MRELELLAPAGNLEIFKSVIDCGADAVYFGGDLFSARAYAKNFSNLEAETAIDYAHIRGKKAYLTLNTLLKNKEINKELFDYVKFYYQAGLDGVIVQDFGVFNFIKEYFPGLELHASTQMTLNSKYGAEFLKEAGASRIVTSRELSLEEIKKIYDDTGIEIEAFVHGALCYCYSGQCLMSSIIGARSGNRGRCAQPCRLPNDLYKQGKKVNTKGQYQLSPKDLCGINDLKAMADAGVVSFKIEGRMKQEEYATTVVSIYRKYMDLLLQDGHYIVDDKDYQMLLNAGNRCGFTNSYFYKHNDKDMITYLSPSHEKNSSISAVNNKDSKLSITGSFYGGINEEIIFTVNYKDIFVTKTGPKGSLANNRPVDTTIIYEKLNKTGNTDFIFDDIDINIPEDFFIPIKDVNEIRRSALEELKNSLLNKRTMPKDLESSALEGISRLNNSDKNAVLKKPYIFASTFEQLKAIKESQFDKNIVVSYELLDQLDLSLIKEFFINMPEIFRDNEDFFDCFRQHLATCKGIFANSFDEIQYLISLGIAKEKIIINHRLYTYSNLSIKAFEDSGYSNFVAPLELNNYELRHRNNSNSMFVIYGYYPLMVTANCINKNNLKCDKEEKLLQLKDRKNALFNVRNHCKLCYNLIYNSLPTLLFKEKNKIKELGFDSLILDFTIENYNQTQKVLNIYNDIFNLQKDAAIDFEYTTGHFKRGVE